MVAPDSLARTNTGQSTASAFEGRRGASSAGVVNPRAAGAVRAAPDSAARSGSHELLRRISSARHRAAASISASPAPVMKPVLVLQHLPTDGPGYLAEWLAGAGIAMDLRTAAPATIRATVGLRRAGGAGRRDERQRRPAVAARGQALIREAIARGVPVIGHCLGGQLMARALGARSSHRRCPKSAGTISSGQPAAADWFGDEVLGDDAPPVFQWHDEAFSLPPAATRLAGNAACVNQAFALGPASGDAVPRRARCRQARAIWIDGHIAGRHLRPRRAPAADPDCRRRCSAPRRRRLAAQQRLAAHAYRRWLSRLPAETAALANAFAIGSRSRRLAHAFRSRGTARRALLGERSISHEQDFAS